MLYPYEKGGQALHGNLENRRYMDLDPPPRQNIVAHYPTKLSLLSLAVVALVVVVVVVIVVVVVCLYYTVSGARIQHDTYSLCLYHTVSGARIQHDTYSLCLY
jgi:hypothetical protein